jgi:acetyl esterase/lipase
MTAPTAVDRFWNAAARGFLKPTLALVRAPGPLRLLMQIQAALLPPAPAGTQTTEAQIGGVPETAPVLLYAHGGGFMLGSPRTHLSLIARIAAAAGCRAIAIAYRLAPEHPFPAARDDCNAVIQALRDAGTALALAGDSAGGCLALQMAIEARDRGGPMPKALALLCPIADLTGEAASLTANESTERLIPLSWGEAALRAYVGTADPHTPEVSPIFADLHALPPTLIQMTPGEILEDDARRLADRLEQAGTPVRLSPYRDLFHVWHINAGRAPAADRAVAEIGAFLAANLAAP